MRKRRLDLGLLQKDVAAQLRADEGSVWNWEANRTVPALRFLPRIVEFLGYVPFPLNGSLPERLKVYRQALGLSQRRLAETLGVDPGTLAGGNGAHDAQPGCLSRSSKPSWLL